MGQYEWNVMPFGLKNAPSELKKVIDEIMRPLADLAVVYIDDVLVFSPTVVAHLKHLRALRSVIERYGMALSAKKMKLFQKEVDLLGQKIQEGQIKEQVQRQATKREISLLCEMRCDALPFRVELLL